MKITLVYFVLFTVIAINAEMKADDTIEVTEEFVRDVLMPALKMMKKLKMSSSNAAIVPMESSQKPLNDCGLNDNAIVQDSEIVEMDPEEESEDTPKRRLTVTRYDPITGLYRNTYYPDYYRIIYPNLY